MERIKRRNPAHVAAEKHLVSELLRIRRNFIQNWDDERDSGNGIIVTLHYGWSFEPENCGHEGVRGFDTFEEARKMTEAKRLHPCACALCTEEKRKASEKFRQSLGRALGKALYG